MNNRAAYVVASAAVLIQLAPASHALSLGELRGAVLLGHPLDVSVTVRAAEGEDLSPSCLTAEVYLADLLQKAPRVTLTPLAGGTLPTATVRIQSPVAVDEPVVTLVLRSACGSNTSRSYVLLTDFPVPDVLPLVSVTEPLSSRASAARPVPSAPAEPAAVVAPATAPVVAPRPRPARPGPAPVRAQPTRKTVPAVASKPPVKAPVAPQPAVVPQPAAARPVLKLDTQVTADVPVAAALAASAASAAAAASAPVAVPELSPEQVLQAERMAALQADLKALKDLALQNETRLADFQSKLRQAESERVPALWFNVVLGLLLLCLAALSWLVWRQSRAKDARDAAWWQRPQTPEPGLTGGQAAAGGPDSAYVLTPVEAAHTGASATPVPPPVAAAPQDSLDIDLDSLTDPKSVEVSLALPPAAVATLPPDAVLAPAKAVTAHSMSAETISDIRQQAEFFVSLGQTERALRLLRKQITDSTDAHPGVYLDLLALYHSLGLKADFREYRAAFNLAFNGVMPDFPAFHLEGNDLLAYPETLAKLEMLWPSVEVKAFLEACIFRNAQGAEAQAFDLAAFRDLLMLREMAEKVGFDNPWKPTVASALDAARPAGPQTSPAMRALDLKFQEAADTQVLGGPTVASPLDVDFPLLPKSGV